MMLWTERSLPSPTTRKADSDLCEFHGRGAFLIVVGHTVDPRADGIAPHQPSIVGLQQIGCCTHIPYVEAICYRQHLLG
jgi:hypothetical protein